MSSPSPPNIYIRPKCLVDSVVLYWRQPVSNGGSEVNMYTVTCASPVYNQTLSGNTYQLTIPALTAGTDYTFQITATNDAGTSQPATFRTVQVGLKPGGATNVTASTTTSTSALVNWQFSTNTGEAPTKWFVLTAVPSTIGVPIIRRSAHGYETERTIFGLAPLNSYQIIVQAVSDVAYAPPTAISNAIATGINGGTPPPPPLTYWLPTGVSGMQVWYDGSDPLGTGSFPGDGTSVPTWYDKSGNSRNATATGSPQFTTYSQNSLSGVAFVGNTLIYYTTTIPVATFSAATTFFIVYKSTQNNGNNGLLSRSRSGANIGNPDLINDGMTIQNTASQYDNSYYVTNVYNTSTSMLEITVDQYGNSVSEWLNGASVAVTGTDSPLTPGTADAINDKLYIGTRGDLGTSFAGIYYEILVYNKVLTQSERETIEGYLAWKWDLQASLPVGHAFISAAPATSQTVTGRKTALLLRAKNYSGTGPWLDESGNGNDASVENGAISTTVNGIVLDGSTSLTLANLALGSSWTINVWYKDDGTSGTSPAIVTQTTNPNAGVLYDGTAGRGVGGASGTTFNLVAGQWTNIQVTNDGINMITYINGISVGSVANTSVPADNSTSYRIGGAATDPSTNGYVTGVIGEVRIYNYAAPLAQVQADYAGSLQNFGFSPNLVTGLKAWYDATDAATTQPANGATVSTWKDKSANAYNATSGGGDPQFVANAQNGLPGIFFPISPLTYYSASIPATTFRNATTYFIVYKNLQDAGNNTLLVRGSATNYDSNPMIISQYRYITMYDISGGTLAGKQYAGAQAYNTTPSIFNMALDQKGNSLVERVNGTLVNTFAGNNLTFAFNPNTADFNLELLLIGTRFGLFDVQFCGIFNEILAFSEAPSETERQAIEGYLAWKWGLRTRLPANHPYYSNPLPPTTITTIPRKQLLLLKASSYTGSGAWSDESGNGYNASLSTGTIAKNTDGNGIILDGLTAWTFPNVGLPNQWSMNVWFKKTVEQAGAIIGQQSSTDKNINAAIVLNTTTFAGLFSDSAALYNGTSITFAPNVWTNIQVTWDGQDMITYVDGANVDVARITAYTTLNTNPYYIGSNYDQSQFAAGEIGEVRMYNYAIGPLKVQQDYLNSYNTFMFNPALDISGCQLWLDGADFTTITLSANTVTAWADKSGNSNNTNAYTGTPTYYTVSGFNGVVFNGSSSLSLPNGTIPYNDTSYTIYIVANIARGNDNSTLLASGDDGSGGSYTAIHAGSSSTLVVDWVPITTGSFVQSNSFLLATNYQSGGDASLYQNGSLGATVTPSGARTQTNTLNILGAKVANVQGLTGTIHEVLVYDTVHTTGEQELIEGYLAWKWSLQVLLPSTHAYYSYPPVAT